MPSATTPPSGSTGCDDVDAVFANLAVRGRRRLLAALYDKAPTPLTRNDLATYIAPVALADGGESERKAVQQALVSLHHVHVPKLETAGLIQEDPDQGTLALTDHQAFADAGIIDVLENEADADSESLDALFTALADGRRRTALDILSHQYGPIHVETLAREIGAVDANVAESEVSDDTIHRILASLQHVHLPLLSEADLVEYDRAEATVAYTGHAQLRVPWMHSVFEPDFRASLTGESEPQEVGTIEGREQVVSFGQSLCDRADHELFCLFTATGLLEAGCFTRIRDAARRGANVYLGTCDPTVREFVREHAPEVVLWEPKTDWLDFPVQERRIGRLVFADREAVMLGTLGERDSDGVHEERAIIGEGADTTLVTMIRQMVEPQIEDLADQSEHASNRLPF